MKSEERKRLQPSRQLASLLRAAIDSGELGPGDQLPSERNLAEVHHVARNTAREAVRMLADEGLVTIEHGRGAFVRTKSKLLRFGASRYSQQIRDETGLSPYRAEVERQGKTPNVDCVSITKVPAPDFVAERLGIPCGEQVIRRENHYFADGEPMQIGVTYIPTDIAGETVLASSPALGPGSLYERFAERGHEISYTREEVSARMPDPLETTLLKIPSGVALLHVVHTGIDQDQKPFEVTTFSLRADTNALDYLIPIKDA